MVRSTVRGPTSPRATINSTRVSSLAPASRSAVVAARRRFSVRIRGEENAILP
jgi:hypothetical protein